MIRNCMQPSGGRWKVLWVSVWILLMFSVPLAGAGKVTDFSADLVSIDKQGQIKANNRIYVMPQRMRMEVAAPHGEGQMIMIFHRDKNVQYMIRPEQKKYCRLEINEQEMEAAFKEDIEQQVIKNLGTEKVNGYKCRKMVSETTVNIMGMTRKSRVTVWKADAFDFPMRTQNEDGSLQEMRNIKKGRPPAKLFAPPKGYTQVSGMMALFMDGAPAARGAKSAGGAPGNLPFKLPKGLKLPFGE